MVEVYVREELNQVDVGKNVVEEVVAEVEEEPEEVGAEEEVQGTQTTILLWTRIH